MTTLPPPQQTQPIRQAQLAARFQQVRAHSLALVQGLSAEDCMVQSMPDASPVKWHLAHITWFFETFLLEPVEPGFAPFDAAFRVLFNSYYVGVGERHPRPARGVLSRPGLDQVLAYRRAVEQRVGTLLAGPTLPATVLDLVELGLHHEQQHQELILTDLLHHFASNPLLPAYRTSPHTAPAIPLDPAPSATPALTAFATFQGGAVEIGHVGTGFAFDNESPRHTVWLAPFRIADRCVTQGEYLRFVEDGGYTRPELWLSDGWDTVARDGWRCPLYWRRPAAGQPGSWQVFGLDGLQPLDPARPVSQLSYYEADAYARWADARLPTEAEWEHAATQAQWPLPDPVWQWTQSAYLPYPGFAPAAGAVGEYNGKFMVNQMVLRGGSVATPPGHVRASYRNFFPPAARWQFAGIRLANNL